MPLENDVQNSFVKCNWKKAIEKCIGKVPFKNAIGKRHLKFLWKMPLKNGIGKRHCKMPQENAKPNCFVQDRWKKNAV